MKVTETDVAGLVTAAQLGDRQALDRLVAAHLPLVYNIVARALDDHADVDDVVQNTMLRAVRNLSSLRTPASFRSWLAAIAVRQAGTHLHQQATRERTAPLDAALHEPDPGAEVEDVTALRTRVSAQRREVAAATRWLDPDDRTVLSLWWQEVAGLMSRAELAEAAQLSTAHAGVRIQRTLEQLELARAVVAALAARPVCSRLAPVIADWDGRPGALWRKRIVRHVRSCPTCVAVAQDRIPANRLLAGLPVLALPSGLIEATIAQSAAVGTAAAAAPAVAAATGAKALLAKLVVGHPLAAAVAGVTAAAAITVPLVHQPEPAPRAPDVIAAPAPTAPPDTTPPPAAPSPSTPATSASVGPIPLGRLSLEWVGGGYLTAGGGTDVAAVSGTAATGGPQNRRRATFVAVTGLGDPTCVSFRTLDGRYLRHYELAGYTHAPQDTAIFRQDATYCPRPGVTAGSVMLNSLNYPDFFLRWDGTRLGIGYRKDAREFRTASSFRVRPALTTG